MSPPQQDHVLATIDSARSHGLLHLSSSNLQRVPRAVFTLSSSLVRLDLSANLLTTLPDEIASLTLLQSLWLSDNPRLVSLPSALARCSQLMTLDVRATALASLPCELARLSHLRVLDIGDTPLERAWISKGHLPQPSSKPFALEAQREQCERVLRKLTTKDERSQLKISLRERLCDEVYRVERRDTVTGAIVHRAVQRLCKHFARPEELRSVIRHAARLFPTLPAGASPSVDLAAALEAIDETAFRTTFDALMTETERIKRMADLELKLRALYFDRLDPSRVPPLVQSIYGAIPDLKDLNFLLKHAKELFPPDAKDVDGPDLARRVRVLQEELARERQVAVDKLRAAVKAIYSDTEPDAVQRLVTDVAVLFKSITDLRSLAADASTLFPSEFLNAQANEIRAAFIQHKHAALGKTTSKITTQTTAKIRTTP